MLPDTTLNSRPPVPLLRALLSVQTWRRVLWRARLPALLLHALLFVCLYSVLYCFGIISHAPEPSRLLSWDSSVYKVIAEVGYDKPELGKNAFFPFFPYFWRFSQLGATGISLWNMACALSGASLMAYTFSLTSRQVMLIVSMPAMLFTMVPYSEGFAFLFGSALLCGLHRRNLPLTLLALFMCCVNRAAATIFVPAFLFAELTTWDNSGPLSRRTWVRLLTGLLAMALALAVVMYTQYVQTGDPLAFYHIQALWGHVLQLPTFPLTSTAGVNVLWLDGTGLLLALTATITCLTLGLWWLWRLASNRGQLADSRLPLSRAVLFSLSYLVGTGFFVIMFQAGDLANISRYTMAAPFLTVVLWQLWQGKPATRWVIGGAAVACLAIALALGFPFRLDNFVAGEATFYFLLFSAYIFAFIFSVRSSSPWYREISTGLYMINLLMLCYLFNLFLDGIWVN
jgi:hypothetical protein